MQPLGPEIREEMEHGSLSRGFDRVGYEPPEPKAPGMGAVDWVLLSLGVLAGIFFMAMAWCRKFT